MRLGGLALLIVTVVLAAPLATAAPAQADLQIGLRSPPRASPGMFKQRFGHGRRVITRTVIVERLIEVPVETAEAPEVPRVDRPERPRLHEAPGSETAAPAASVTVLRPIGRRVATPEQ